jgi:hypothetical protein
VYHLIYRSQASTPLDDAQLTHLLEQSRAFNLGHDLTGLLLYTPDHQFLQVLEGDEHVVRALYYGRIVHDLRHHDCFVLSEGPGLQRSFADWSMGFLTHQHTDVATEPGFVEMSRVRHLLPLLASDPPGLRQLLLDFVARHDPLD